MIFKWYGGNPRFVMVVPCFNLVIWNYSQKRLMRYNRHDSLKIIAGYVEVHCHKPMWMYRRIAARDRAQE